MKNGVTVEVVDVLAEANFPYEYTIRFLGEYESDRAWPTLQVDEENFGINWPNQAGACAAWVDGTAHASQTRRY